MATVGMFGRYITIKLFHCCSSNINVIKYYRYCSIFSKHYSQSTQHLTPACNLVMPIGYSHLIRNYATGSENVHQQKQTAIFPQAKIFPQANDGTEQNKGSERNKSEEEEDRLKRESAWRTMKLTLIAMCSTITFLGGYVIFTFGSPVRNDDGSFEEDEFSRLPILLQYPKRAYKSMVFYTKMIQEPSSKKLLPDPLKFPYMQPPYTLVLELTDLLVHAEWTYNTGWRFKKRPGLDQFLEQCAPPLYEIVIYTAEPGWIAYPLLTSLDPNGYIMYRLFRDATDYRNGHHTKNLDCLNRDLKRVIVVDWNPNSVQMHRANNFLIPRWNGEDNDTALLDLAAFLRTIATNEVDDVRDVLVHYSQFDDPLQTFKEKQRLLMEEMEKEKEKEKKKVPGTLPWKPKFA